MKDPRCLSRKADLTALMIMSLSVSASNMVPKWSKMLSREETVLAVAIMWMSSAYVLV